MMVAKSMLDLEKSVLQPSARQRSGSAAALRTDSARHKAANSAMTTIPERLASPADAGSGTLKPAMTR